MIILFGSEGGPRGRNDVLMKVAGRGCEFYATKFYCFFIWGRVYLTAAMGSSHEKISSNNLLDIKSFDALLLVSYSLVDLRSASLLESKDLYDHILPRKILCL